MKQNENLTEQQLNKKNSSLKKKLICFIIFTIILALLCGFLTWRLFDEKTLVKQMMIEKNKIEIEKKEMLTKLSNLECDYNKLITEHKDLDSIFTKEKEKIVALQRKIKQSTGSIEQYKQQLEALTNRLKDYLKQITELKYQNKTLSIENIKIKSDFDSSIAKNASLTSENTFLNQKVKQGSFLKAYGVTSYGIYMKGSQMVVTKKAKKIQRIRTCFTISENAFATKENKSFYARIVGIDKKILVPETETAPFFEYKGKEIAYSIKKDIYYDGKEINICMYWDKIENFKKGIYDVDIFVDGYQVGTASFTLE